MALVSAASGSAPPVADEPVIPWTEDANLSQRVDAMVDALEPLLADGNSLCDGTTAISWLRIIRAASMDYEAFRSNAVLARVVRLLARRERFTGLPLSDRKAYVLLLDQIMGQLAGRDDLRCIAWTEGYNPKPCRMAARDGGTTCRTPRHLARGADITAPSDDLRSTGHPAEFVCLVCGDPSEDHTPEDLGCGPVACLVCERQAGAGCAGIEPDFEGRLVCSRCNASNLWRAGIIFTNGCDADGLPTHCERRVVQIVSQDAAVEQRATRGANPSAREPAPTPGGAPPFVAAQPGTAGGSSGLYEDRPGPSGATRTADYPDVMRAGGGGGPWGPLGHGHVTPSSDEAARLAETIFQLQAQVNSLTQRLEQRPVAPVPVEPSTTPHAGGEPTSTHSGANNHGYPPGVPYWMQPGVPRLSQAAFSGPKGFPSDAAGRVPSHASHWMSDNYGRAIDFLGLSSDKHDQAFRSSLGHVNDEPPSRDNFLEWSAALIDYHSRLMTIEGDFFTHASLHGMRRAERTLTVIVRCRWLVALLCAMERDGRPSDWEAQKALLQWVVRTDFTGSTRDPFNHLMHTAVMQQWNLYGSGEVPSLSDALQKQLQQSAKGRLAMLAFATAPPAAATKPPAKRAIECSLCGGNHYMTRHHKDMPITIPCSVCGDLHARTGPLASPCKK